MEQMALGAAPLARWAAAGYKRRGSAKLEMRKL
jgi:hypothetical protein